MQPLQATRSRSRLLLLAALFVLLPAPALVLAGHQPRVVWRHQKQSSRGSLDASSPTVQRAAQTAVNYFNFQQGSPNDLRAPGHVKKAYFKVIPGVGRKYILLFGMKDLLNGEYLGSCLASVFYLKSKPKPAVEITCSTNQDRGAHRQMQDNALYHRLRGDKEPSVVHLWGLGVYGSSFIAWQMSTEDLAYTFTQIKHVKPWKREDDSLEFDYSVLLSEVAAEASISCHMRIVWHPSQPAQVKYDCSSEDSSSESADGSGVEPGSTDEDFLFSK